MCIRDRSKDKELKELRASLETINKTSSELISDIDRNYAEIMKEREAETVSYTQLDVYKRQQCIGSHRSGVTHAYQFAGGDAL